ncbi:MAG: LysM peptidoglycan-binding domain-containing protein [Bacteroidetes bacterium]|nr:LysM peptidoglycan-binding domain-containing protein [Bacteroidota bacterium]
MSNQVLEIFISVFIVGFQLFLFYSSKRKVNELRDFFPEAEFDENDLEIVDVNNQLTEVIKDKTSLFSDDFSAVIKSINRYLNKNRGAIDFGIVKNILDRSIESKENRITSTISLPLYLGLMGTFIGVVLGLVFISFSGKKYHEVKPGETLQSISQIYNVAEDKIYSLNDGLKEHFEKKGNLKDYNSSKRSNIPTLQEGRILIDEGGVSSQKNVESFIGGVVIAMIASFFGLLLTVINNAYNFKIAKTICDERKNQFLNFLQTCLLPYLESSLYDALDKLKLNINDFNKKFETNINLFDSKFNENISSLKTSVQSLSENINYVVDNTKTQKEFLVELKRMGYNRMAEANIKVFQLLKDSGPTFIEFINNQKELNQTIQITSQFLSVLSENTQQSYLIAKNLLDRISSFEQNINNLGERIDTSGYLGSEVLKRIDKNLSYLDNQFELLKRHEISSTQTINEYFEKEFNKIQELVSNIKKEIERALDLNIDQNPFQKLLVLEAVDKNILLIKDNLQSDGNWTVINESIISTKSILTELNSKITKVIEDNKIKIGKKPKPPQPPVKEGLIQRFINRFRRKEGGKP